MKKAANGTGSRKAARLRVGGKSAARTGKKLGGRAMAEKKATGDGAERNVDQIRDILFGGQMRDYERRFVEFDARLESELARLRDAQEKRLAQIDKRIDESLDKLGKLLRQEIQDRNRSLDDLESRIQQAARTSRSEVATSLEAHAAELAATDERLRGALADLAKAAHARAGETDAAISRLGAELRGEKVGREDLSALLTELALRLTGEFDLPPAK